MFLSCNIAEEVTKMSEKLYIKKNDRLRGEDGYRLFSVRLREDLLDELDELVIESKHSRNKLINILIEYAIQNCEIEE